MPQPGTYPIPETLPKSLTATVVRAGVAALKEKQPLSTLATTTSLNGSYKPLTIRYGSQIMLPRKVMEAAGWKSNYYLDFEVLSDGTVLLRHRPKAAKAMMAISRAEKAAREAGKPFEQHAGTLAAGDTESREDVGPKRPPGRPRLDGLEPGSPEAIAADIEKRRQRQRDYQAKRREEIKAFLAEHPEHQVKMGRPRTRTRKNANEATSSTTQGIMATTHTATTHAATTHAAEEDTDEAVPKTIRSTVHLNSSGIKMSPTRSFDEQVPVLAAYRRINREEARLTLLEVMKKLPGTVENMEMVVRELRRTPTQFGEDEQLDLVEWINAQPVAVRRAGGAYVQEDYDEIEELENDDSQDSDPQDVE